MEKRPDASLNAAQDSLVAAYRAGQSLRPPAPRGGRGKGDCVTVDSPEG